ncbi:hypothetical protein [Paenibacillus thalictri]|uniref:hypothetical protein n=1 Tax=Paenibacillus thalictri TaxID=2527873 RepID=UPI0013EF18BE|nr:hypothetical protein [Paenibacillus thalictri]
MDKNAANYEPLRLNAESEVLERIRKFEEDLTSELGQTVSVVAYSPHQEAEAMGHS